MYDPTKDYPILKIAAVLLYAVGFVIMITGLVISIAAYPVILNVLLAFVSDDGPRYAIIMARALGVIAVVLVGSLWLCAGLAPIVLSQLIEVFLDIRNDVRRMTNN